MDLICYILISEIICDTELTWLTLYQTEGLVYLLALPIGLLTYESINMKRWELLRYKLATICVLGILCLIISFNLPWLSLMLPLILAIYMYGGAAYSCIFQACANILKIEYEEYLEGNAHLDRKSITIPESLLQLGVKELTRKYSTGILANHFGVVPLSQIPADEPRRRFKVLARKITLVLKEIKYHKHGHRIKFAEKYPRVNKDGGFKKGDFSSDSEAERIASKEILGDSDESLESRNSKSIKFLKDETFRSKENSQLQPQSLEEIEKIEAAPNPSGSSILKPTLKKGLSLFQDDFEAQNGTSNRELVNIGLSREQNIHPAVKPVGVAGNSMNLAAPISSTSYNYQTAATEKEGDQTFGPADDTEGVNIYNPLDWPEDSWNKVYYIILFPVNLVLFFIFPNIAEPPSSNKIFIVLFMCIVCTIGITMLLLVFEYSIMQEYGLKLQLISTFNSVLFMFPKLHDILTRARAIQDLSKRAHYISTCFHQTILKLCLMYPASQIWSLLIKGAVVQTLYNTPSLVFLALLIFYLLVILLIELISGAAPWNKHMGYFSLAILLLFTASILMF
jgi:hypothetical protein